VLFCILRIPAFIMTIDKQVYYAIGKSEINLYYEIGLCILNIITLMITTQLGIFYIAIGATSVEYIGVVVICVIASRVYGYSLSERIADIYKPTIASAIMAITVLMIGKMCVLSLFETLLLQILCGAIVYLLSCMLLKDRNLCELKSVVMNLLHKSTR